RGNSRAGLQGPEQRARAVDLHLAVREQLAAELLRLGAAGAGGVRHGARVQRHVPLLDTLGRERTHRRHVRGEPDGGHDAGQLARQSLPVASASASMPFMMPLLWVAARYGSAAANSYAAIMRSATSAPSKPSRASAASGTRTAARASRRSARFERMRRHVVPP